MIKMDDRRSLFNPGNIEFLPEMRLLLSCCCKTFSEEHKINIIKMIHEGLNWEKFIGLVIYHQVLPIVYFNLREHAAGLVPYPVLNRLKTRCNKQKIHSMRLIAELVRIVKLCREEGIEVICLKGPVLALQLYGDISFRHAGDIDLLVDRQEIDRIHHLMSHTGYEIKQKEQKEIFSSPRCRKVFMKSFQHILYFHKKERLRIEFHYRLFKNPYFFPYNKEWLLRSLLPFNYGGTTLNVLPFLDNSLYLFAHGSSHKWFRLKWLSDIARLSCIETQDWGKLFSYAEELGLDRTVAQGLLLSNYLLNTPLPGNFHQLSFKEKIVSKITHKAVLEIMRTTKPNHQPWELPHLRRRPYLLMLKKNLRYKMFHLRIFFYIDVNRQVLKLPEVLFPLYYVLNPFLWFYRKFIIRKGWFRKKK
jgi:hypothetical protein